MLSGVWWMERDGRQSATLLIEPLRRWPAPVRDEVVSEAERALAFVAEEDATRAVRVVEAVVS